MMLDYEDTRDWPSLGLEEADPVWVWLSLDSVSNNWLSINNKRIRSVISMEEEPWRWSLLNQLQTNIRDTEGERWTEIKKTMSRLNLVTRHIVRRRLDFAVGQE